MNILRYLKDKFENWGYPPLLIRIYDALKNEKIIRVDDEHTRHILFNNKISLYLYKTIQNKYYVEIGKNNYKVISIELSKRNFYKFKNKFDNDILDFIINE